MSLWCTSGADRFRPLIAIYSKDCSACILVFALDDYKSFEDIRKWHSDWAKAPIVYLVGTKRDIPAEDRKVDRREAEMLAEELNARYYEVSAKNNSIYRELENMFMDLSHAI
jgi:GTPase SAR1 family protein